MNFSEPKKHFVRIFDSSLEVQRVKQKFSDDINIVHFILELFNNLVELWIAASEKKIII